MSHTEQPEEIKSTTSIVEAAKKVSALYYDGNFQNKAFLVVMQELFGMPMD